MREHKILLSFATAINMAEQPSICRFPVVFVVFTSPLFLLCAIFLSLTSFLNPAWGNGEWKRLLDYRIVETVWDHMNHSLLPQESRKISRYKNLGEHVCERKNHIRWKYFWHHEISHSHFMVTCSKSTSLFYW